MLTSKPLSELNPERVQELIRKVGPDVELIFHQMKEDLGGRLPEDFSYGLVCGYLRGKGFTWEESFLGMDRYIKVITKLISEPKTIDGIFTIVGREDGTVKCNLENKK